MPEITPGATHAPGPSHPPRLRWGARFAPHVLVPVRPGLASLVVYLLGLAMAAYAAMKLTVWVFRRQTREYGESVRGYGLRF